MDALENLLASKVDYYPLSKKRLMAYNQMVEAFEAGQSMEEMPLDDSQLDMLAAAGSMMKEDTPSFFRPEDED